MSFLKQSSILIRNSYNNLYNISTENGVFFNYIDSNFNIKKTQEISSHPSSLSSIYCDIDSDDNIYGLFTEKGNNLVYLHINASFMSKTQLLQYYENEYIIKFPFIKCLDNKVHIIYYEINKKKNCLATLVHYYKKNSTWLKTTIDILNYNLLNNFEVLLSKNNLKIYYLKLLDEYEELFVSTYNLKEEKWDIPIQLTSSRKPKVYLSIIKDSKSIYHITYSEKNENQFYCKYMNLFFENNFPSIKNDLFLNTHTSSIFPNLIKYKNLLYCQWMEYNHLYTCYSIDNGNNWSNAKICTDSYSYYFTQFLFKTNSNIDEYIIAPKFYSYKNSLNLLGLNIQHL